MYSKQYDIYMTVYSYHLVQGIIVNLYISVISYILLICFFFSHEIVVDIQYLRINK